jgi:hypothetical protein
MDIFATHKIVNDLSDKDSFQNYVVGSDKAIYRLPTEKDGKNFYLRKLKPYRNKYKLNGRYFHWTEIETEEINPPYLLIKSKEVPFNIK